MSENISSDNVFLFIRDLNTKFERLIKLERQYGTTLRLFKNKKVVKLDELRELVGLLNYFVRVQRLELIPIKRAIEENLFANNENTLKGLKYLIENSCQLSIKAQEYRDLHRRFYESNGSFYILIYELNSTFNVGIDFYDNSKIEPTKKNNTVKLTEHQIKVIDELLKEYKLSHVYRHLKDERKFIDITEREFVSFLNSERGYKLDPKKRFTPLTNLSIPIKLEDDFKRLNSEI